MHQHWFSAVVSRGEAELSLKVAPERVYLIFGILYERMISSAVHTSDFHILE